MGDIQVAALRKMVSAVNAAEAGRYAVLYAPDAAITIFGTGRLEGREAIERHEIDLLRRYPGTRFGLHSMWRKGGAAAVHYAVNGATPDGRAMGHEGLLFYRFEESGLIQSERRYMDSMTPMAQLGMLGSPESRPLPDMPRRMSVHDGTGSRREDENVALLARALTTKDAKNEAAVLATFEEDGVIDELVLPRPFIGKGSAREWLQSWTLAIPGAAEEIVEIMGVGDFVLAETVVRGSLQGRFGALQPSPSPFAAHRAILARVGQGRIESLRGFMNAAEIAQATGQWPPAAA